MRPPKVENEAQLAALATAMEQRAAARFYLMAQQAREGSREDLCRLFTELAERKEEQGERSCALAGLSAAELPAVAADWLAGFEGAESGPIAAEIIRTSPYLALAAAVRGEERAFAFFSYIAGEAEAPAVEALAEALAKERLQQAHDLRRARRQAYRRFKAYDRAWPRPEEVDSLEALEKAAAQGEAALLSLTAAWRDQLPVFAEIEAMLLEELSGLRVRSEDIPGQQLPSTPEAALRAALDRLQTAFEYYDTVATGAKRQDVMFKAQALTAMSLSRIEAVGAALLR